jgi:hypothetical protein
LTVCQCSYEGVLRRVEIHKEEGRGFYGLITPKAYRYVCPWRVQTRQDVINLRKIHKLAKRDAKTKWNEHLKFKGPKAAKCIQAVIDLCEYIYHYPRKDAPDPEIMAMIEFPENGVLNERETLEHEIASLQKTLEEKTKELAIVKRKEIEYYEV